MLITRKLMLVAVSIAFGSFANPASAQTACGFAVTDTANFVNKIAIGHAWTEHKQEFVAGAVYGIAMPSTPRVTTTAEFKAHVQTVVGSSVSKTLSNGRKAWWWSATGTFVVFNPADSDCGTAFRPTDGKAYYDRQT